MKFFTSSLLSELNNQLEVVHSSYPEPILYAEQAVLISIKKLEELKTFFIKYKFESRHEEIEFFKTLKPKFVSILIYYNEIYNIELNKPIGHKKALKRHYSCHIKRLNNFFKENAEFIKYSKSQNNYLDKKYFLRKKHDIRLTLDSFYFQSDYNFSTSHDYKVAQIMANEKLINHLENNIKILRFTKPQITNKNGNSLKWTGSKVALVELIYALHADSVINNGDIRLKEIALAFETIFNIKLGQFNRTFLEICNRKTIDKTVFLNTLKEKLLVRIENSEK
ncbi:tetracycline regulation of excision, RteC [Flavobacterium silvisoli]|uniref:Tetracycline regulation of excision, RteC n=1 Tax=Flavobacterium silvisoli TaxID=2529433 RepID=A0A4Q9YRE5_9FLAO|nr:RteC domain-containing protein [Flavobacterium silvisoli]TBX66118.1 tetracycline regulation of excision, RteC [Flavobacterium silvisoli]